ncbi:MAG: cbb3-type cytochrome c oxidase subunit 3 [Pseudomonadota bacterium]
MQTDTYSLLREFADSWWLVAMFGFFVFVVLFTLRPGSGKVHRDIADIPLRDDDQTRLRDLDADDPRKEA